MNQYPYYSNLESAVGSFLSIPRLFFTHTSYQKLTSEAKIIYSMLLEKMELCEENEWYDEQNRAFIYFPQNKLEEFMNIGYGKIEKALEELDVKTGLGLIERQKQELGLPTKIYIKNFASIEDCTPDHSDTTSSIPNNILPFPHTMTGGYHS